MGKIVAIAIAAVMAVSCGHVRQLASAGGASPTQALPSPPAATSPLTAPSRSAAPRPSPPPAPTGAVTTASAARRAHESPAPSVAFPPPDTLARGLLMAGNYLELINADATTAASLEIVPPSVQDVCAQAGGSQVVQPPVAASDHHVYFRDGDTYISMIIPPSNWVDVTTVPGGPHKLSSFAVSPDDQRIAVVVQDFTDPASVSLNLYVEDLVGHRHHSDIYSTKTPRNGGTTLWPMGWHQGNLVLAVMPLCASAPNEASPLEWHVSSAATANRIATITGTSCTFSLRPSPAGISCMELRVNVGITTAYDWTGTVIGKADPQGPGDWGVTGLSPNGRLVYIDSDPRGNPDVRYSYTIIRNYSDNSAAPGYYNVTANNHTACGWIDDDHLLAPDAVITLSSQSPGYPTVSPLGAQGTCVGRFPGGL